MIKLLTLLIISILSIGCINRNNPYDPGADNYNEELQSFNLAKFTPDTIEGLSNAEITFRLVNLTEKATSLHIEFDNQNVTIDSINVLSNKENSFVTFYKNKFNINYSGGSPLLGTENVATIYLSNLPLNGTLNYTGMLFNDDVSEEQQSIEVTLTDWQAPYIK